MTTTGSHDRGFTSVVINLISYVLALQALAKAAWGSGAI